MRTSVGLEHSRQRSVPFSDEKKRVQNLAAAIEKSLKWNVDKMGKAARKEVEKYDYRNIVGKYIKIYKIKKS